MHPSSATHVNLVGRSETHLCSAEAGDVLGARVHRDVVAPFYDLRTAARGQGYELAVLSGFRSFDRQLSIWNRKVRGELPVLDSSGHPLDVRALSERDLVLAILRWSALPGASRHHWGTDVDIYDKAATPAGYEVELIPSEVDPGGIFGPLHQWLDARIASGEAMGFFRPYDVDRGGVAPERWHLSYAPLASTYAAMLTPELLRQTLEGTDILLKDVVLQLLPTIFERFVINTNPGFL